MTINMKNHSFFRNIALMACMIMSLSSCNVIWDPIGDPDVNQSIKFAGQWTGDFGMYYSYRYMGRTYTFDSYDTDIVFYPEFDGATYGWGKQVDYYEKGPYTHIYNRFDWEILQGVVYIKYYSDNGMDCAIYDYVMTNNRFSGRFGNSTDRFYLTKIADYYDWSIYLDYYFLFPNTGWHWAPRLSGQAGTATEDTLTLPMRRAVPGDDNDGIVSFGRRF